MRSQEQREVAMSNSSSPEPRFAALRLSVPDSPPAPRAWPRFVSMALHAALLVLVLVVPLLRDEGLPEKVDQVQAFFAAPAEFAPPPPPPPPRAVSRAVPRARAEVPAPGFVAPVEVPTEIVPEEGLDLGEGGMPGGVEGGVPGGVVGGVVGGLPEAPPPPAVQPVRVGGGVREPRKVRSVAPVYPDLAVKARVQGRVILECQIDVRGRVVEVNVLRGNPLLLDAAVEAVRQWVYTPTLLNGVPVPVLMAVTVTFQLTDPR
jgi:protein TonB